MKNDPRPSLALNDQHEHTMANEKWQMKNEK
jgi:hypothetical protein